MPRPILIRSKNLPYHIRARSNNKEWFHLPLKKVWEIFLENWEETIANYQISLHAFVLMANHIHAIVSTPNQNLDAGMHHLLRETSRDINKSSSRINHVFGGPYKWSLIGNKRYYEHALRYVYQNPVKAGVCNRVEEYPYSTIGYFHSKATYPFELSESVFDRQSVMDLSYSEKLEWLNEKYTKEENDNIRKALRHSEFRFRQYNISLNTRRRLNIPAPLQANF